MFSNPEKNLRAFDLREDMTVADLGAGTGYYAVILGRMVPRGKVYAVEVQKDLLHTIMNKVRESRLSNVECLWGDIEKNGGTKIREHIIDRVVASNVLFQVEDKNAFIEETKRILKQGGKVLLIDREFPEEKAKSMFEAKGFAYERDIDAGSHHYGMIMEKK